MSPEKQVRISAGGGRAGNSPGRAAASAKQCGVPAPSGQQAWGFQSSGQAGSVTWRRPGLTTPAFLGSSPHLLLGLHPKMTEHHLTGRLSADYLSHSESWCPKPRPQASRERPCFRNFAPRQTRPARACEVRLPDLGVTSLSFRARQQQKAICSQAAYSLFPKTEQNKDTQLKSFLVQCWNYDAGQFTLSRFSRYWQRGFQCLSRPCLGWGDHLLLGLEGRGVPGPVASLLPPDFPYCMSPHAKGTSLLASLILTTLQSTSKFISLMKQIWQGISNQVLMRRAAHMSSDMLLRSSSCVDIPHGRARGWGSRGWKVCLQPSSKAA